MMMMTITINTKFKVGQYVFVAHQNGIEQVQVYGFQVYDNDDYKVIVYDNRGSKTGLLESELYATWREAYDVFVENKRKEYEKQYDDDK